MTSKTPRKSVRPARPELLRAGFRLSFFALVTLLALASHRYAAVPALAGIGAGAISLRVARRRRAAYAHSFVCLDYLLLGTSLALAGNCSSWLLLVVPLLVFGQLMVSPRQQWALLLAPTLLLVIVLGIADGSFGGDRTAGLAKLFVLVVAAGAAANEARRPRHRRRTKVHSVDATTGFYTKERLRGVLNERMGDVAARHDPLAVVCLKLDHFADTRAFVGGPASELLVRAVAHRIERHLADDDVALRVAPDTFVLALPGRSSGEARETAAAICHDVAAQLIDRRRQTMRCGVSSYPTLRRLEPLLQCAYDDMTGAAASEGDGWQEAPQALPVAAAR
jgi:diguanylate cyclase (GGDEF)-like protein